MRKGEMINYKPRLASLRFLFIELPHHYLLAFFLLHAFVQDIKVSEESREVFSWAMY